MSPSSSIQNDPRLLPLLPLICVAWADGELTEDEIGRIRDHALELPWLQEPQRQELRRWLDPGSPPSAVALESLLEALRAGASDLPPERRRSLASLGSELVALEGNGDAPARDQVLEALGRVEEAIGLVPTEASRELLDEPADERLTKATLERAEVARSPEFDPAELRALFDGDHADLRARLRELLCQPEFERRPGLDKEAYRDRVLEWARELAENGFGALHLPPELGGGGRLVDFMVAFETIAEHDLSLVTKFGVQFGLWGGSVLWLGTKEQQTRWLPPTARLDLPGCFAMTELAHGSNVRELETTATWDPERGDFVLHSPHEGARKEYIGNAARHGRIATVFAQLQVDQHEHGVHAFVVDLRDDDGETLEGVRIEDCGWKAGLNGVDNGRIWLDHVRVPRDRLLARYGHVDEEGRYTSPISSQSKRFFTMLGTLVGGRIGVAAAANSAARAGLMIALRYAQRRRQFGLPDRRELRLLDYPIHRRRLLPRLAATWASVFAVHELRDDFASHPGDDRVEIEHRAAAIKAFATWNALDVLQECRECCGGVGYLAENRFGELREDADVFATFEGDNTVLLQLVAKGLLSDFRRQFADSRLSGLARWVTSRAVVALAEKNPVRIRRTDPDHLRSAEMQSAALLYREERLLATLAQRLRARLSDGVDAQVAVLECQTHLVTTAVAHVERTVFEAVVRRIDTETPSTELSEALHRLRALFGLSLLERRRGWFLEQDYFEDAKAKAVRDEVDRLCTELRDVAVPLADGFAIPDRLLAAPIAIT